MFQATKKFFVTTVIGGVTVVLPAVILIFAIKWLFGMVSNAIRPLTDVVVKNMPLPALYDESIATLLVLLVILLGCFFMGLFIRTHLGRMMYDSIETSILSKAPGYKVIKETVNQFLGKKKSPFSSVALVQIFENHTKATAFVTDEHADGSFTVFIPTGPNPTSGQIFHLAGEFVHPVDISVEDAMRSIISCGAGSGMLIEEFKKKGAETA